MYHNQHNSSAIPVGPFEMTWDNGNANSSAPPLETWSYCYDIRHSIFLLTGVCVGLPLVIWVLGLLHQQHLKGGRVSSFVIALLVTDLLEMILSPAILTYLLVPDVIRSGYVFLLFFGVKYCGVHLHQMVALERVMTRRYLPVSSLCLRQSFSILFCLIEGVFLLLCLFVHPFIQTTTVTLLWLLVAVIILGITCKLTFTTTTSLSSVTVSEEDHMVLAVATLSLFMLYGPFLAFEFAQVSIASFERHANGILAAATVVHPAVCLRLIVDPLLCVLVVRQLPLTGQATARTSV